MLDSKRHSFLSGELCKATRCLPQRPRHCTAEARPLQLPFKAERIECSWYLESPILSLEGVRAFSRAVVACCERGVAVFWHDALAERAEMIAVELKRPRAVFLGNGTLVLLAGESDGRGCEGRVADIDRRGIQSEATFYRKGETPLALVATEFAVFDGTSEAAIWLLRVGR